MTLPPRPRPKPDREFNFDPSIDYLEQVRKKPLKEKKGLPRNKDDYR